MNKNITETQHIVFTGDINEINAKRLIVICAQAINKKKEHIYISFSSNGGHINAGLSLYNSIKALPIKTTFHNTGSVESAAILVFLSGDIRCASKNSRFLIHEPIRTFNRKQSLTMSQMSELVQILKNDCQQTSDIIKRHTSVSQRVINNWFRTGKLIDPETALAMGFVETIKGFRVPLTADVTTVATEVC